MSTYLALYRKWRPKNFEDLVGQEHVARTLSNAITGSKLAHAYLFTGPRGTGKTSTARIFAKSLNCASGPTVRPCETCAACEGINRGNFPDVIEIDAASNRGVDDARDLRDRVRFAPTHGRYKVFIIDEVHMLTNEAFNALLKTIEEPPPNLVFILATTDVHKVLPTIISRCQRFDFQRIAFTDLVGRLRFVTEQEGFSLETAGLEAIAKRADGGLRDALSLLDQVRACASTETISAADVFNALGIVSNEAVVNIVRSIADSQVVPAIEGLQALLAAGFDHHGIIRELLEFFRHMMLVGVAGDRTQALEIPEAQLTALKELAPRLSMPEILYAMEVLRETENLLKGSNQMTVWLEMALIRLSQREEIPSVTDLMRRVAALEERMAGGLQPAPGPRPTTRPTMAPPAAVAPAPVPAQPAPTPVSAPAAAPPAAVPAVAAPVPVAAEPAPDGGDDLVTFLGVLARVHRSTHSLLEQHGLYARRSGATLTVGIKATMRSFFEKADRKVYLDKAAVQAFGPGVHTSLAFETGDTARPKLAGVSPAPAAPTPAPPAPVIPTAVTPAPAPAPMATPVEVAVPVAPPQPVPQAVPPAAPPEPRAVPPATTTSEPPTVAPRVPDPLPAADEPVGGAAPRELVNRTADIFNGRVIEPTL